MAAEVNSLDDLEHMLPHGVPSLRCCSSLSVEGTVIFGKDVKCEGSVKVIATSEAYIPDGTVLRGEIRL